MERCSSVCQQDLCLPDDIRSKFGSFDFTNDDALELWEYLEAVVEEFHGDAEKYFMNFYGLLHETLSHKSLKEILLLQISCYLKLQIIF